MFSFRRQRQLAGTNAQQFQVAGDLVVGAFSEAQAREIATSVASSVIAQFTADAIVTGRTRIEVFDEKLVRQMMLEDRLSAFADPGFQILLKKAQAGAASTEREPDLDMLVRLLGDRASRGDDRLVRAGLDRAVQIVDQIDDSALTGLTVFIAVHQFSPTAGQVSQGLDTMERLFSQLCVSSLPQGSAWLDHLDVLDAVRISSVGSLPKFQDVYGNLLAGYVAPGVESGSEAEAEAFASCAGANLTMAPEEHELRPGFRRLPFVTQAAFDRALATSEKLTHEQRRVAAEVARDKYGLGQTESGILPELLKAVRTRPTLREVQEWWDAIPIAVQVTPIGRVLARANAKRLDEAGMLPALD